MFNCSIMHRWSCMNSSSEHRRLLYKIADDYYFKDLTQNEIAQRLGISRIKVSRLLRQAREEKIVTITLAMPPDLCTELEEVIEHRYGVEEAVVVSVDSKTGELPKDGLAAAAAECLLRRLTDDAVVGVAMGKTMMSVVHALPSKPFPNIKIVQMNGSLNQVMSLDQSAELARQMAAKLSAELHLMHAPGIAASKEAARVFKNDPLVSSTLSLAARADIAILSIGKLGPNSPTLRNALLLAGDDVSLFVHRGIIGDIALRFIDSQGRQVKTPLDDRIIGLEFEQLRRIPCVIAVAGGKEKHEVIRAALLSGIPKVLVTDQLTAEFLLK